MNKRFRWDEEKQELVELEKPDHAADLDDELQRVIAERDRGRGPYL